MLAACGNGLTDRGNSGGGDPGGGGGNNGGGGNGGGGSGSGQLGGAIGPGTPAEDPPVPPDAFYVATTGDDSAAGTLAAPWRTLRRACSNLAPGDTLVVRGGVYAEREIPLPRSGTAGAPIAIRNHPGEQPIVDGGYPQFRSAGNSDWQVVDASRAIWRSTATFAGAGQVYGYLGEADGGHRLVPYERMADLTADLEDYSETTPFYCGPGVFWNGADQRIWIRLQPSREQARFGLQNVPAGTDPRQTPLVVFPDQKILALAATTSHVVVSGLALRHGGRIADVGASCHHLTLRRCELRIGRYGVIVRGGAHDLAFDGLVVSGSFPAWIARSDVKAAVKPAHLMQDAAFEFSGQVTGVVIANCRFLGLFDGIDSSGTPSDFAVHHCEFATIRDDAFEVASAGHHVEFHHNFVHRAAAAVSWNGSTAPPAGAAGTKYVHHNVVDTSEHQFYGRADPQRLSPTKWLGPRGDGMATGPAFGVHDTGALDGPDPWKVYCNTFVGGADVDAEGLGVAYKFPPFATATPHEVFDNVFVQTADQWIVRRGRVADGSQVFDGNLYWRTARSPGTALLQELGDGSTTRSFASLVQFTTSSLWLASRSRYAPGWEVAGVEADPQLDADYVPAAGGPAASGAVDLSARGWPGATAEVHRGAIAPR